jgi:seryl-tRNA synthetase
MMSEDEYTKSVLSQVEEFLKIAETDNPQDTKKALEKMLLLLDQTIDVNNKKIDEMRENIKSLSIFSEFEELNDELEAAACQLRQTQAQLARHVATLPEVDVEDMGAAMALFDALRAVDFSSKAQDVIAGKISALLKKRIG